LRHEFQIVTGLLVHLVSAGPFEIEEAGQDVFAGIYRHYPSHDSADFRIIEAYRYAPEQPFWGKIVGIEDYDDLTGSLFHGCIQGRRLAPITFITVKGFYYGISRGISV